MERPFCELMYKAHSTDSLVSVSDSVEHCRGLLGGGNWTLPSDVFGIKRFHVSAEYN